MAMAFTPPRPLGDAMQWRDHDAQIVGLVGLFSQLGRAAAIASPDGRLLNLNRAAELLVQTGDIAVRGGRLEPLRSSDHTAFTAMLESVGKKPISKRVAISGGDGRTLLTQALALSADIAGTDKVLVIFDNPSRANAVDPVPALQLLGLTPAEARIAGLVGAGRSPREAADVLALSLNTVRSTLKIVFDKLGISRQAELATIVTRLAG
jgi:DNA-binding CsgD family transcriptional regulator